MKRVYLLQVVLSDRANYLDLQIARWGHTLTTITQKQGHCEEAIMFGGSPKSDCYDVDWSVYKMEGFPRTANAVSLLFGKLVYMQST